MSGAYDSWMKDNIVPVVIKWEGIDIFNVEYLRGGIALLLQMLDSPEDWAKDDIVYPKASVSITVKTGQPFLPREITFDEFVKTVRAAYDEMCSSGRFPTYTKVDGYDSDFSSKAVLATLCRAFHYYDANECFPETIDTWESSYTAPTNNCQVNAPEVKTARDAAWKAYGVTETSTVRQKADAIFKYARDEWEWEDYYNTKKGAVGTIKGKSGNCCDLSNAICAMARLSGIPARYFHAQCNYSSGVIGHVISQLFIDGEWVFADASNNDNDLGSVRFNGYTGLHYYENLEF